MRVRRYVYLLVLLFWLLCLAPAWAQPTYPIQVNTHLLPPYSLYLSDYYSSSRDKLTVTLVNRDQRTPSVNVRLRLSITAAGGTRLQTNEGAVFQPVLVETGSPVRLTQEDLAQYFQPNNLVTQGFLTAGRLPEGMVEFCIQAVEAYTGRALSASTCTRAWITSQKPPLLSLPANNESVAFREPLNVMFQWTPMHQGLAQVEYDFILKELWDNGMTPQAAFAYSPEIYRETTRSTSLIYGAFQPPLLAGKRYAWCVRAKAREGMDELNVFQNDGYSEIRWFGLQDDCLPPEYVEATPERTRINFRWEPRPAHIGFTISYREKSADGKTQNAWKEENTLEPLATVYGLKSGTMYEYRVGSMCMAGQPVYTPIMQVYVPIADSARLAQCGIMPDLNLQNQEPIKELKTSEVFRAGDFPVTIVTISGANGTFTGQGFTVIPWLNDAKVAVEFRSIGINTDRQMIRGIVEAKYDKKEGQIGNLDELLEGGFNQGKVVTGITRTDTSFNFVIPDESSFGLDNDGQLVIVDADEKSHVIPTVDPGETPKDNEGDKVLVFPMTVKDKNGTVYKVEKTTETVDGQEKEVVKATKLGTIGVPLPADAFDTAMIAEDMAIVRFQRGNGRYSFDTWQDYYKDIQLIRVKYQKLGSNYYAPWKLLPGGESDEVSATIQVVKSDVIDPKKVIFITKKGTRYDATYDDNTYTFSVTSGPEGDVQELYALHPKSDGKYYTLGKLSIATYARQEREVVLVAVQNTHVDYDVIERTLHTVYDSVGIHWTVHRDAFPYTDDGGFMANATGLSTYNEKMRALNAAYRAAKGKDFKPGANYIFFLKATGNVEVGKRELTGFMPRGAQFGYIFTSETADAFEPIAVAHELGHGRWKLYHPFDKNYGAYPAAAEKTNNLMAYGNGPHIAKWQWDQLADPALVMNIFQGDERSEHSTGPQEDSLPARIAARVKELQEESKGKVVAILYCKECETTATGIEENIRPEVITMRGLGQFCLALTLNVSGDQVQILENKLVVNQTLKDKELLKLLLPAIGGDDSQTLGFYNAKEEYTSCIKYLDENFFSQFDYCKQRLSDEKPYELYEQLLTAVAKCLGVEYVPGRNPAQAGDFVGDEILHAVDKTLGEPLGQEYISVSFASGDREIRKGAQKNATLKVRYTQDSTTGKWRVEAQFSDEFVKKLSDSPYFKKHGDYPKILADLENALNDLVNAAQVRFCEEGEIGVHCVEEELRFLQVMSLNMESLANNGAIDEAMWHSTDGKRNVMPKDAKWSPIDGGVVDETLDEVVGIYTAAKTIGEVYLYEEKREAMKQVFAANGIAEMIGREIQSWVESDSEQIQYKSSRAVVMLAFFYFAWEEAAAANIDDAMRKAEQLTRQLDNAPTLKRQMAEISKLGKLGVSRTRQIQELIDKLGADQLENIVRRVDPAQVKDLLDDLANNTTFRDGVTRNVDISISWID